MNQYTAGTLVQMNLTVTNALNAPVSPTALSFKIQTPDGIVTDYSSAIIQTGAGTYYAQFTPVQYGLHEYEWIGTGAAQVATVSQFLVNQQTF